MTPEKAREVLRGLVGRYIEDERERAEAMVVIDNRELERVPVKAILARIDRAQGAPFSDADNRLVEELVYYYL